MYYNTFGIFYQNLLVASSITLELLASSRTAKFTTVNPKLGLISLFALRP